MKRIIIALAILMVAVSCLHELSMTHRQRTPKEAKMFIAYMNRDPVIEKIAKVLGQLFPYESVPNMYSYPEEKIYNYLDAQYYGYILRYLETLVSVLHHNHSVLFLTQDHRTYGFHQKNADYHLHAIFTNTLIVQNHQPISMMVENSTLPMVQEQLSDTLVLMMFLLPDYPLNKLNLDKLQH